MPIKKTVTLYYVEELKPEIQAKVYEKFRGVNITDNWYNEDMELLEFSDEEIEQYLSPDMQIKYRNRKENLFDWNILSYGLNAQSIQYFDLKISDDEIFRNFLFNGLTDKYNWSPEKLSDIINQVYYIDNKQDKVTRILFEPTCDFEEQELLESVEYRFYEKMLKGLDRLINRYKYLRSNEAIKFYFEMNNYMFLANGDLYPPDLDN